MNFKHGCTVKSSRNRSNPAWRAHYCWIGMRSRCTNTRHKSFPDYGGRGITVDPAWEDFGRFYADMGDPPPVMTIERIDNDGPYSKANCRWATRKEQSRNRRTKNRFLEHNGERRLICEWAEHLGVNPRLLRVRLNRGWSVADTLTRPCDPEAGRFKAA